MATMWGARDQFLVDITQAAQKRIKTNTFLGAEGAKEEIERICAPLAAKYNGKLVKADLKGSDRASEKVANDYGGDWYGIKDVARMTIVVATDYLCYALMEDMKLYFVASRGYGVVSEKYVHAREDPCGYSGLTLVVRTKNGWPGEIQINVPTIIYAKQSERSVRRALGDLEYMNINTKYQLEGGMGHKLYEVYRSGGMGRTAAAQRAATLSQAYYAYFRRMPDPQLAVSLRAQLIDLLGWKFRT